MAFRRRSRLALLALVLALLWVRPAAAAITFDSSATTCQTGAGTTLNCSFPAAKPTAGSLVVVFLTANSSTGGVTFATPTDNQTGNTYTATRTICSNNSCIGNNGAATLYFALNVNVSGTYTVTEAPSVCAGTCEISIGLMSFSGVATATATDGGVSDFGSSTTRDGGSFTTANANDVVVMNGTDIVATTTLSPGTGYTSPSGFTITNNTNQNIYGEYQIVSVAQAYNPPMTGATTGAWGGLDEAFKAAAGAASPPTRTLLGVGKVAP